MQLTWQSVLAWRAQRQFLGVSRPPVGSAIDVISRICGLHAQLMSSAELTLWARVEGLERDAVSAWVWEDRTLVKTWALRGTLHLLPSEELPIWVAAQSMVKPRHHLGSWLKAYKLTREQADAMLAAIPRALDRRQLTREELAVEVGRVTGIDGVEDNLRRGFGDLLKPAAFRGDLCFAPSEGRSVKFARPDQWLGSQEPVELPEAAAEVARRYLSVYGPATPEAFSRWFGAQSPAVAGRWLRSLGDELAEVEIEGEPRLMLAADVEAAAAAEPDEAVRLLPAFDHHVVAAPRDSEAVLAATLRERVYRPQGWLSPVLLVGGRMAGVWSHELKGDRVLVAIEPFSRLGKGVAAAAEAEAERLAAFLGGALELSWER